jgi:glycerol-3-phosphate dehydrogenase
MQRDFHKLGQDSFDLLIVGGGITGATLAWDAVLRGLKVALVDQGDFAAATTSATSKLIHGGLRYLKNGEVGLVRESLCERRILQRIAPHLVYPIPFLIPTYKQGGNRRWMIKAGMLVYDLLSWDRGRLEDPERRIPGHRMLSSQRVLEAEPGVVPERLTGGAVYYDCRCEPERLCLEFILGAAQRGAVVVNYARVTGLIRNNCVVAGAEVQDRLGGGQCRVSADMVANVAGPWTDSIDVLSGVEEEIALKRSKGIHIVTRPLVRKYTVVLQTALGRHFFIIPWRGHSLIGTTDTEYQGRPDELSVLDEDVGGFIAEINGAYPSAALRPEDVLYRYVGVRSLVDRETEVYEASRKYEIVDHEQRGLKGYITALGGKYTTSRNLASKVASKVLARLGRPKTACGTQDTLLPGGVPGRFSEYLRSSCAEAGNLLEEEVLQNLIWTYGARHTGVLELLKNDAALGERIRGDRPEILAQVVFSVREEMAGTLCDILTRRTGIGTLGHPGDEALDKVTGLAARLLGWDPERVESEKKIYLDKTRGLAESCAACLGNEGRV